jgi:hypothetical protein
MHTRAQLTINRPFFPKACYRIVFKVCTPVRAVMALGVVFRTLCDGAAGTDEFLQFCDITNLAVIQASHFCTSINISIVMLVVATYFLYEWFGEAKRPRVRYKMGRRWCSWNPNGALCGFGHMFQG